MLRRFRLLLDTVRYLTVSQVYGRLKRKLWRRIDRLVGAPSTAKEVPKVVVGRGVLQTGVVEGLPETIDRGKAAAEGRFEFLNREVSFVGRLGWHDENLSQLWRYHLHYFHFLEELTVWAWSGQRSEAWQAGRRWMWDWMESNQRIVGDGWHPYTISLRLVNWIEWFRSFPDEFAEDVEFRDLVLKSMWRQGEVLFRDREFDVRGNHLLENLRALIWLGMFFDGPVANRWLVETFKDLELEVAEQVLPDGGHFERSPGYHLVVMKDLLEIGWLMRRNEREVPTWLTAALERMAQYLREIITPDGRVPLLKDTALDAAPDASDLLAVAAAFLDRSELKPDRAGGRLVCLWLNEGERATLGDWPSSASESSVHSALETGHCITRDSAAGHFLVFDVGKVCPDYLPAHGQADMFTFELFLHGRPVVVDSGIYEYAAGPWRNFFRATRAHNTLELAGENSSEVWSSFRVARRAHPRAVSCGNAGELSWWTAKHDGYRRIGAGDHQRIVVWHQPAVWIVIDRGLAANDVNYRDLVHLHPDLDPERTNPESYTVDVAGHPVHLQGFGHSETEVVRGTVNGEHRGWYSERFGRKRENAVLTFTGKTEEGMPFGYVISAGGPVSTITRKMTTDGWEVDVVVAGNKVKIQERAGNLSASLSKQ